MTTDEAARENANLQRKQGDLVEKLLTTIEKLTEENAALKAKLEKGANEIPRSGN